MLLLGQWMFYTASFWIFQPTSGRAYMFLGYFPQQSFFHMPNFVKISVFVKWSQTQNTSSPCKTTVHSYFTFLQLWNSGQHKLSPIQACTRPASCAFGSRPRIHSPSAMQMDLNVEDLHKEIPAIVFLCEDAKTALIIKSPASSHSYNSQDTFPKVKPGCFAV